ncbi:unnamed protein product [Amoebophrya sp. A25]|nr:unnamed protein product [Amoebophrya sp. A25]|eukprot:GSA25T00024144001.1
MNDYVRHRAGQLHPNPHVHATWWTKALTKHRHDMKTLMSPVKKMMTSGTPVCARRASVVVGGGRPSSSRAHNSSRTTLQRPSSAPRVRPSSALPRPSSWQEEKSAELPPQRVDPRQTVNPRPAVRTRETLRKIEDTFLSCLEELDEVESSVCRDEDVALLRKFALLKIYVFLKISPSSSGKRFLSHLPTLKNASRKRSKGLRRFAE